MLDVRLVLAEQHVVNPVCIVVIPQKGSQSAMLQHVASEKAACPDVLAVQARQCCSVSATCRDLQCSCTVVVWGDMSLPLYMQQVL